MSMDILIEFYSENQTDNIVSFLHKKYDRVVYLYPSYLIPDEKTKLNLAYFAGELSDSEISFSEVSDFSFTGICDSLNDIITSNGTDNDFTVDITGGSEMLLSATGYFMCSHSGEKNIHLHMYNVYTDKCIFSFPEENKQEARRKDLSVEQEILLNGGRVVRVNQSNSYDFSDRKFRHEVIRLWVAVRSLPSEWNRFCSLPNYLKDDDPLVFSKKMVKKNDRIFSERVLSAMKKNNVVTDYIFQKNENDVWFVNYKLSSKCCSRELYKKSGTLLELFTCLASFGTHQFTDCTTSVIADYNGVITRMSGEPRNEMDVVLMRNNRPVCISCKNTKVTKEFLYEIQTLTLHFGGKYAIPCIVSSLPSDSATKLRAGEMGIILIDHVSDLSLKEMRSQMISMVK